MAFFPVSSGVSWYASCYIVAYCFTPFIKKSLPSFHEDWKLYKQFLAISFVACVGFGFVTPFNSIVSKFTFMIFMFYVGDFIRYYDWKRKLSITQCILLIAGIKTIEFCFSLLIEFLTNKVSSEFLFFTEYLINRFGIGTMIDSILCVIMFSKIRLKSKIINKAAISTFGIYLFHTNPLIQEYIWGKPFSASITSNFSVWRFFAKTIFVFLGCFAIEQIRQFFFGLSFTKKTDRDTICKD